jgi:DNA repair exonuclease SbcCD ATPase subunit
MTGNCGLPAAAAEQAWRNTLAAPAQRSGGMRMRILACVVVGLTLAIAGCDSDMRSQLESDVKSLEAKCDVLKRENETLRLAIDNLRAEKTVMEKDLARLKSDTNSLKRQLESEKESAAAQIEQLKAQLAAARRATPSPGATAVAPGPTAPTDAGSPTIPGTTATPPAPVRDEAQIAEIERAAAELDAKITALQARANQSRDRILSLARATIDVGMVCPPGGAIIDGQVCRRDNDYPYPPYYRFVPIGPAVKKGDFATNREKDAAIQTEKDKLLQLELQLKGMRDELAKTKSKLAKLRAAPAPN